MTDRILNHPPGACAAQYLRMSTSDQQYSIANQVGAIAAYAAKHNYDIVETYCDAGCSGIRLSGRPALQRLLADIAAGAGYSTVLVLDVSRWGRFQSIDESAHYEFVCRQLGVNIVYCDEPFSNGRSVIDDMLKVIKRAMAAEYSRDLSSKTATAHVRLATLGFWQGGPAPFGLRRQVQSARGVLEGTLQTGEHKSLATDRVILTRGPDSELRVVRFVFAAFTDHKLSPTLIARILGRTQQGGVASFQWTAAKVRYMLSNGAYAGNLTYGRMSSRLGRARTINPDEHWVTRDHAFAAIISSRDFARTAACMAEYVALGRAQKRRQWQSGLSELPARTIAGLEKRLQIGSGGFAALSLDHREPPWRPAIVHRLTGSDHDLPGWIARTYFHASILERRFYDSFYGSSAASMAAADLWSKQQRGLIAEYVLLGHRLNPSRINKTGFVGVSFCKDDRSSRDYWLARWQGADGRHYERRFRVATFGTKSAKRLAIAARQEANQVALRRREELRTYFKEQSLKGHLEKLNRSTSVELT